MAFPKPFWRPENREINLLPQRVYKGPVKLVQNHHQWKEALTDIKLEKIIGFDTETRPSFIKGTTYPPSLIQLATDKAVYLIQLNKFPFEKECAAILGNPDQIKAGAAPGDDMIALSRLHPFTPANVVDLGKLAESMHLPNHGLRTLAASLFGWRIAKGAQCSNWNAQKLTSRQIAYAATDAWISRLIYLKLNEPGFLKDGAGS